MSTISKTHRSHLRKSVTFRLEPTIQYFEKAKNQKPAMTKSEFQNFKREEVTDEMLQGASKLFNENYGIWGESAGGGPTAGSRVKMSKTRLQSQCFPPNADCYYARVLVDDCLAGNVFACTWSFKEKTVCWITQLVIHHEYRQRGLALGLLNQFKGYDIYGLMSSHPAACLAASKAYGSSINSVSLDFIRQNAAAIMAESPVAYVHGAELKGSLFNPQDASGAASSVYSKFYVDHAEPLEALRVVRETEEWPLGELLDGHEFLLLIAAKKRRTSSQASSRASSQAGS